METIRLSVWEYENVYKIPRSSINRRKIRRLLLIRKIISKIARKKRKERLSFFVQTLETRASLQWRIHPRLFSTIRRQRK